MTIFTKPSFDALGPYEDKYSQLQTEIMCVGISVGHALTKAMLTHVCFPKDPNHELLFPKVVFTTEEAAEIKRLQPVGKLLAPL